MNSKQRVLTTFEHKEPDRVPLCEPWIESEIISQLGGDAYKARETLGIDCLPLGFHPKSTKAYRHGIDEWGRIFKNGQYGGGVLQTWADLEFYTAPLSHAEDWFPLEAVLKTKEKYGEEYAYYFAWHDCSLGLSYMSMGMEKFFIDLYERPEFVKAVIERSTEWVVALVRQANMIEVEFIVLGDDVADNNRSMISPQMFHKLIIPEYKKIIKAADVPIIWHSDGNVKQLIPMIIAAGFSGVHSLEPKANINLSKVKEEFGGKLVLAGNVDTTQVLCQTDLRIVREDVERAINQGAHGGGYLFSSSNSLFEGHNIDAIIAAYNHAKRIGTYPINI